MSLLMEAPRKLIPKLLLHVSVQEIYNSMASPPEEGGMKEERDKDNNIIVSDSTLSNILPPQLKNTTSQCKVMCGRNCCISDKIKHSSLLSWRKRFWKHTYIKSAMHKTEGLLKWPIVYLRHIKILSCHMENIFFRHHMTLQWQQYVHIHYKTIHYSIGNVFCVVLRNLHGWIFQV